MPNNERIAPVAPDVRPMPETATIDGQPAWLARHVGVALGYQSPDHVGQAAKAGRDDFDPSVHVVYDSGEVYLTASGVRHACARRRRGKREAARLLAHIEAETAPRREWSTREPYIPGKVTPSQPWPRRPNTSSHWGHREAEKAKREEAAELAATSRRRRSMQSAAFCVVGGAGWLYAGVKFSQQSVLGGAACLAGAAVTFFLAGWRWGSR